MNIVIQKIKMGDIDFNDFVVLAILIAILYGLTAFEYLSTIRPLFNDSKGRQLKKASAWSFYGIISTIIAGIISDLDISFMFEYPLIIIPLFFIFKWFELHKSGSRLANMNILKENILDLYEQQIIGVLKKSKGGMSAEKVFNKLILNEEFFLEIEKIIKNSTPLNFIINKINLKEVINPFLIKMDKVEKILKKLKSEGIIKYNSNDNCYFKES